LEPETVGLQIDLDLQLLTDESGIYGFGFQPVGGQQVVECIKPIPDVVLRADRTETSTMVSHMTLAFVSFTEPDPSETPEYSNSLEQAFVHIQATLIARRKGMLNAEIEPICDAHAPEIPERLQRKYDAYYGEAFAMVRHIIQAAYDSCVPPHLLPLLRQFTRSRRYQIYTHAVGSPWFAQLIEVFPVLGIKMFHSSGSTGLPDDVLAQARRMVEEGCKLNKIAETMEVPTAMRKISPQEAHVYVPYTKHLFKYRADISNFWDRNAGNIREWLQAIFRANFWQRTEYAAWLVRNFHELTVGPNADQDRKNLSDWVQSCLEGTGSRSSRPFIKTMSARTVERLSDEWHRNTEGIYNAILGVKLPGNWREIPEANGCETEEEYSEIIRKKIADKTLPKAWLTDAEINGILIKATTNELELIEASLYLKNCGGTYSNRIYTGECCIYTASHGTEVLAMIEVQKHHRGFHVAQCAGYLNQSPSTQILDAIREWESTFPINPEPTWEEIYTSENWEVEIWPNVI